jgi:hypothetical protein
MRIRPFMTRLFGGSAMMFPVCAATFRLSLLALAQAVLLAASPMAAAQPSDRPCADDAVIADNYQSQAVGLTVPELTALYGPNDVGQGSIFFDLDGIQLHKRGCDLILVFPQDESFEQVDETALAESLLPADAELVGTFALGTTIASYEANTLWRSPSLAERFSGMDENRGGEILIVYTYEPMGTTIQRVELRTLELPE